MKNNFFICCMITMMIAMPVRSQSSHWNCDIHAYQYDMTVYLQLKAGTHVLTDYADYEVAAFCDEECRGEAVVLSTGQGENPTSILRVRVRSNTTTGDNISFKVYQKSTNEEKALSDVITFESLAVKGLPSQPLLFQLNNLLMGDVNGDGEVDLSDAIMVTYYSLGVVPTDFIEAAADMNGDNDIDLSDAIIIIYTSLGVYD